MWQCSERGRLVRILGVDHGERRIGIAISDPTGTLARSLAIIEHESRAADVKRVLALAREHGAEEIVVGESLDEQGQPNLAGRRAGLFAEVLRASAGLRVVMWDESLSSQDARRIRIAGGASRKRRREHIDAAAAAVILQSYLDSQQAGKLGEQR
jgi:putative Holliday junction resolvase